MLGTYHGTTALVFAGGGSIGAVQVGMLDALVSSGFQPDFVVGSSVGAINAAYYAGHPEPEGVARLEAIWLGLDRSDIFPLSPFSLLRSMVSNRFALVSPRPLRRLLETELPFRLIGNAEIPLHVVVTRLMDGAEKVCSDGSVIETLMASTSIPGIFPPVAIDGVTYIDGSISSNTPIAAAIALGATRVVVLPTGSPCASAHPPRGAIGIAIHALNLLVMRQLIHDLERHSDAAELIVIPPLCPLAPAVYEFSQTQELIESAQQSTQAWLEIPHGAAGMIPPELQPHVHSEPTAKNGEGHASQRTLNAPRSFPL